MNYASHYIKPPVELFNLSVITNLLLARKNHFHYDEHGLTIRLLVLPGNNFCKQFGSRSGPTKSRAWSGSKLFDTLMVLFFFKKMM